MVAVIGWRDVATDRDRTIGTLEILPSGGNDCYKYNFVGKNYDYEPIEFVVRRELQTQHDTLAGLYDGAPHKTTDRPTTERLLNAFHGITLLRIQIGPEVQYRLSGFSKLHRRILQLLSLPLSLYTALEGGP